MKSPSHSLIGKLTDNGNIFYEFPDFYGKLMEKYVPTSQWPEYHQLMRGHKRFVETLSSMMFRIAEHLEDWASDRYSEEERKAAREKAVLGMLIFVPVLTAFCIKLQANDGILGKPASGYFYEYVETFRDIWISAVDTANGTPYPEFMPSNAEFEPHLEFFYDFVEEMKTIADAAFVTFAGEVYMRLYRMQEDIAEAEKRSLVERQYIEHIFAKDLVKAAEEVKTLNDSLTESGFKNENLDTLLEMLNSSVEKYRTCDQYFESAAKRVFGNKFTLLNS